MELILLEKEINENLGMVSSAKNLFKKINKLDDEYIVLDFTNVKFMGRAFTQEYIAQKTYSKKKILEIRKPTDIAMMLFVVWGDYFYYKFPNCKKCPYSVYFYHDNNLYCGVGTDANSIIKKDMINCEYRDDLYKKLKERCELND